MTIHLFTSLSICVSLICNTPLDDYKTLTSKPQTSVTNSKLTASIELRLSQELQSYSADLLTMNHQALAARFVRDGVLQHESESPIVGAANILAYLQSFVDVKVLANSMAVKKIESMDGVMRQSGEYTQRVRDAKANVLSLRGRFVVDWVFVDGEWKIRQMHTYEM